MSDTVRMVHEKASEGIVIKKTRHVIGNRSSREKNTGSDNSPPAPRWERLSQGRGSTI
jgi:hypothetical protein